MGFASVSEDIDFTTPAGRLLLTMIGGVAEFFSDQLGFHVSKAQRHRAELGLPIGPVPFGYITPDPKRVPIPEERDAKVVQEVFERRARGESNGAIAGWLNYLGLRTRKNRLFTDHAVRDMLQCRFYLGLVQCSGKEYPGQHVRLVSDELFQRVQDRKQQRSTARTVEGPKGLLQGIISCGNCGKGIQSDRHRFGGAMYRERHSQECPTNNRSIMAKTVDQQIEAILTSVELLPEWRDRMAHLAAADTSGPDPEKLKEKRRRLSRAYADGAFSDVEYQSRLAEIDSSLRLAAKVGLPTVEEAAQLFEDIPQLWKEATPEERRKLLSPLIERVYVDMESSGIGAIVPAAGFRRLLEGAVGRAKTPATFLLSDDEAEKLNVWSWWRRGRIELYPKHGLVVVMVDMEKRRKLLLTMLDAVYVDTLEEKAIVGIQPKPAFLPLFEVAAAGEDRDVALFSGPSVSWASATPRTCTRRRGGWPGRPPR